MLQQKKSVVLFILTIILNAREVKAQACTGSTKDCLYVESLGLIGGGPAAVCTDLIYQSNRNQDEFELCACTSASSCSTSTGRCSGCNGCDIYCWDCDSDTGVCVRQGSTGGGGGCDDHDDCPSNEYCDSNNDCWTCSDCASYDDAIDGSCPSKCGGGSAQPTPAPVANPTPKPTPAPVATATPQPTPEATTIVSTSSPTPKPTTNSDTGTSDQTDSSSSSGKNKSNNDNGNLLFLIVLFVVFAIILISTVSFCLCCFFFGMRNSERPSPSLVRMTNSKNSSNPVDIEENKDNVI
mmetsp:Transcript_2190/g.2900  ORF Transcript_2190/g.2900 Transcript_2190/m.2900 type:complete len:295 (+) Transcript_2190:136-1020(+)